LVAGKDVRMLEILRFSKEPFMLPCSICQKEQAFKDIRTYDSYFPDVRKKIPLTINNSNGETEILSEYNKNQFDDYESYEENCLEPSKSKCKSEVLAFSNKFGREYVCQLNQSHRVYGEFIIEEISIKDNPPKEVKEYREKLKIAESNNTERPKKDAAVKEYYEKLKKVEGYIVIKKIGQYPSMADMQFFECKKYSKILKENYRDYTMALGLYASGVGCGSFLYLRRIFEIMVEEFHKECLLQDTWDEEEFQGLHFNEKIQKIEAYGKCIIPNELNEVRNVLYGVLSKGVHESSEDECKELFPYVKQAIDIMLDTKIAQREREDKLKEMRNKLQNSNFAHKN
jgi:hypothetical protein